MSNHILRKVTIDDMTDMLYLINELAIYEKEPDEVDMTLVQLEDDFKDDCFDAFVAVDEDKVIGFALYYFGYSTWKGKTMYLEDFVVAESRRGQGVGKQLFEAIIAEAKNTNCKRMDWQVLDWNEPAINFYNKYEAKLEEGWLNGRFYSEDLKRLWL
jgi:GNAT superfamily N-acetyltransferase